MSVGRTCDRVAIRDADERDMLRLIAAGDQQALRCLYATYRPRLWSYLVHQLDGDAGWTEELMQDVFLTVWRSAATFRGEAQVATWLFRLAHNLAANARRSRDRRPRGERLDVEETDSADVRSDVPASASHEDAVLDRLAFAAALSRLSPLHREVLDLTFVQGFSIVEVATILNVPAGTVKSRISYARRALQAHLAAEASCTGSTSERANTAHTVGVAGGVAGETCREER